MVIPQVRTYTRYGTGSVEMFDYAESLSRNRVSNFPLVLKGDCLVELDAVYTELKVSHK